MRVVLTTTNGSGMGHLSRQTSVAKALGGRLDPVLFSMSTALPLALDRSAPRPARFEDPTLPPTGLPAAGAFQEPETSTSELLGEYCPSYARHWMPRREWHFYLRDRLLALLDETRAGILGFDGVVPYPGVLRARAERSAVAFVWFRRGLWQPGSNARALKASPFFDLIVEPGDLAQEDDRGLTAGRGDALQVGPISLGEVVDQLPREVAAAALGLDPDRRTCLVTLPFAAAAGVSRAVRELVAGGWQVAVTAGPIGDAGDDLGPGVIRLRGVYPLVSYLAAFDAAVAAAGYNAFHELLFAGLPTVFVPRRETGTDDQHGRAAWAMRQGMALSAPDTDPEALATTVGRLRDDATRDELRSALASLPRPTGAFEAAAALVGYGFGTSHTLSAAEKKTLAGLRARDAVVKRVGPTGMALARRLTGRAPAPEDDIRLTVAMSRWAPDAPPPAGAAVVPCVVTEELDPTVLSAGYPLEHLLPGTSEQYRSEREEIARRYYRVG